MILLWPGVGLASSQRNNDKREDAQSHQREVHPEPHVLQTAASISGYALKQNNLLESLLSQLYKVHHIEIAAHLFYITGVHGQIHNTQRS